GCVAEDGCAGAGCLRQKCFVKLLTGDGKPGRDGNVDGSRADVEAKAGNELGVRQNALYGAADRGQNRNGAPVEAPPADLLPRPGFCLAKQSGSAFAGEGQRSVAAGKSATDNQDVMAAIFVCRS